jgi:hypothetical protein
LRARRAALLQAFMQQGRVLVRRLFFLGRVTKTVTGGGDPLRLRKEQNRYAKNAASLRPHVEANGQPPPRTDTPTRIYVERVANHAAQNSRARRESPLRS